MSDNILLVDLSMQEDFLSIYEFVYPIRDYLDKIAIRNMVCHFSKLNSSMLMSASKVILCGTALKDNFYFEKIASFSWILDSTIPILGICAGMQTIGAVFGGRIIKRPAIGLEKIRISLASPLLGNPRDIEGYHLHNYSVSLPDNFLMLAGDPEYPLAFMHSERPIWGIIFHPEVRNQWILKRFAFL